MPVHMLKQHSPALDVVEESNVHITAGTYSKRSKPTKWSEESTDRFYEVCLQVNLCCDVCSSCVCRGRAYRLSASTEPTSASSRTSSLIERVDTFETNSSWKSVRTLRESMPHSLCASPSVREDNVPMRSCCCCCPRLPSTDLTLSQSFSLLHFRPCRFRSQREDGGGSYDAEEARERGCQ